MRNIVRARSTPSASAIIAKASAAISPPTKPPPISLWARNRVTTETTQRSQKKTRLVNVRMNAV